MTNLPAKTATIRELLERSKNQIMMALPKHMDADRLMRVAMTSIQNTPKLLDCDPRSLIGAIIQSAQLGLEPDGVLGEAYLIPFKDKVQFIVGFKGLISLARRSGEIKSLAAHVVYENDVFEFEYGLEEKLRHVPTFKNRGEMIAVYAVAKLVDGGYATEVMSVEEVNSVRDGSQGYQMAKRYKKSSPWDDHYSEMARKTAIRRLSKYLPVSVEMMKAVVLDEQADAGVIQQPVLQFEEPRQITESVSEDLNERFNSSKTIENPHEQKTPVKEKDQDENPEQAKSKVEIKEPDNSGPQKLPGVVSRLKKEIGKIKSVETMELWMNGADEVLNKNLQHDDDKAKVKAFAVDHLNNLKTQEKPQSDQESIQPDEIDNDAFKKERAKIDKLDSTIAIDRWRMNNHERISTTYNAPTAEMIMNHANDVYAVFEQAEAEG